MFELKAVFPLLSDLFDIISKFGAPPELLPSTNLIPLPPPPTTCNAAPVDQPPMPTKPLLSMRTLSKQKLVLSFVLNIIRPGISFEPGVPSTSV